MRLEGVRALLVEHSPTEAEELAILLKSEGAAVEVAGDGEKGWKKFKAGSFDFVLSDVLMPGISGFDLCRKIKEDERGAGVPMVLVTSLSHPFDIVEGLAAGADNFIIKPYVARYLIERICRVMDDKSAAVQEKTRIAADVKFMGRKIRINTGKTQILSLLAIAFEEAVRKSRDLDAKHRDLEKANASMEGYARRLEGLVRVSEERYNILLENASDAVLTLDRETRILSMNRRGEEMFGVGRREVVGRKFLELIPEDRREENEAGFLCRGGESAVIVEKVRMERKDGRPFFAEIACSQANVGDEKLLLVMIRDVTNRLETERRIEVQRAVNSVLASAGSFEEAAPRLLESVCVALVWQWAVCWQVEPACKGLRFQAAWTPPEIDMGPYLRDAAGIVYGSGQGLPGRAWEERRVVWIPDIGSDRELVRAAPITGRILEAGIRTAVAIPIICDGAVVAVIILGRREPGEPDERLIETFMVAGNHIGQFIERKRNERRLKASEEQLRESQKLDAIGQLAGGVAHDFNNMLSPILGYSELVLSGLDPDSQAARDVEEIRRAGERAAALTRQLLAFGRKQTLELRVLNMNDVVRGMEKMLVPLIGEDIRLRMRLAEPLGNVEADSGQLGQVVLNLAVNARDAMPRGGEIVVETANIDLDEAYAAEHADVTAGPHVMLAVSDTGHGMDEETKARIFEPFFTTKEKGKGTGLGLATVYGIVKQSKGNVWVYSEPGKGTTVKVYLPCVLKKVEVVEPRKRSGTGAKPGETILVAEDETAVRDVTKRILEKLGYRVLAVSSGAEALSVCERNQERIDLVLSDVVMRGMSGPELIGRIRAVRAGMKTVLMSGYTGDMVSQREDLEPGTPFVHKPIMADVLAAKIRESLDS